MTTPSFTSSTPPLSHSNRPKKSFSDRLALVSFILSTAALGLSIAGWLTSRPLQIATVDVPKIVTSASETLAKSYPTGNVPKSVMERIVQHIKETTENYGHTHHVMILAKGALLSGEQQDLTDHILKALEQEGGRDGEK